MRRTSVSIEDVLRSPWASGHPTEQKPAVTDRVLRSITGWRTAYIPTCTRGTRRWTPSSGPPGRSCAPSLPCPGMSTKPFSLSCPGGGKGRSCLPQPGSSTAASLTTSCKGRTIQRSRPFARAGSCLPMRQRQSLSPGLSAIWMTCWVAPAVKGFVEHPGTSGAGGRKGGRGSRHTAGHLEIPGPVSGDHRPGQAQRLRIRPGREILPELGNDLSQAISSEVQKAAGRSSTEPTGGISRKKSNEIFSPACFSKPGDLGTGKSYGQAG